MKRLAATTIGKRKRGIDLRTQDFIYPVIVWATTMSYKIDFDRDLDYVTLSVRGVLNMSEARACRGKLQEILRVYDRASVLKVVFVPDFNVKNGQRIPSTRAASMPPPTFPFLSAGLSSSVVSPTWLMHSLSAVAQAPYLRLRLSSLNRRQAELHSTQGRTR